MSLRLRLTVTYIALLIPALVAFSLVIYLITSSRLYSSLDDGLHAHIDTVRTQVSPEAPLTDPTLTDRLLSVDELAVGFAFKVVSRNGDIVYASPRPLARKLPDPANFEAHNKTTMDWKSGKQSIRVSYERLSNNEGDTSGYVVGAVSTEQSDDALERLQGVFALGGILIVILTGVPAYMLAGRALLPVREVSAHAARIERLATFNLTLPTPRGGGEIPELVRTFNAMITRVRRVLVSQRDFLAISSHELRRPLTVLRTYIDVLDDDKLPEAVRKRSLDDMRFEANAMSRLITDLLILAREGEATNYVDEVDVNAICERLMSRLKEQDGNHRYSYVADGDGKVLGDSERIEQMVSNLLDNAAQHTPENGSINLDLAAQNGSVVISVSDTGNGIPADEQPHIFERFFRGAEARTAKLDGYGLGLVIVKHVAEMHGGQVSFISRSGQGSTFTIELPKAGSEPVRAS